MGKILVVDDEEGIRILYTDEFEEENHKGYVISHFSWAERG
jgi:hypothetical protein